MELISGRDGLMKIVGENAARAEFSDSYQFNVGTNFHYATLGYIGGLLTEFYSGVGYNRVDLEDAGVDPLTNIVFRNPDIRQQMKFSLRRTCKGIEVKSVRNYV